MACWYIVEVEILARPERRAREMATGAKSDYKRPYAATGEQPRSRGSEHTVLDGKRMRKPVHRQRVDYSSPVVLYVLSRMWQRDARDASINLEAAPTTGAQMLPPVAYPDWPASSFTTKFVHASINKARCSVNRVLWTPAGRERVFTGCQSGEFTLWNGQSFNFEWILQAHDVAVRSMTWSYNGNWLITGDDGGCIKYWTPTLNLIKAIHTAHKNSAVRDLSFSCTDLKFCSCSDDSVIKIWDFARCDEEERSCKGHNWDVKSCAWHPRNSLIVSGGKDALVKLWDARTGKDLHTIEAHKAAVLKVRWNSNGNWVLTGSKDQAIKLFDVRTMKEMESFHGQKRDVTALAWHPFHEELFVSGGYDGSILYWLVGYETPLAEVANAHEGSVWDLAWHPMGHLLCSGSQDQTTKFWCRHKPGENAHGGKHGTGHKQGHVVHEVAGPNGGGAAYLKDQSLMDGAGRLVGSSVARPDADIIPGVGVISVSQGTAAEVGGFSGAQVHFQGKKGGWRACGADPGSISSQTKFVIGMSCSRRISQLSAPTIFRSVWNSSAHCTSRFSTPVLTAGSLTTALASKTYIICYTGKSVADFRGSSGIERPSRVSDESAAVPGGWTSSGFTNSTGTTFGPGSSWSEPSK